jgi:hypothetical protein
LTISPPPAVGGLRWGADGDIEATKRIMSALVRMPPKPHDQMKLGKPRGKEAKSVPTKRRRKAR